MAAKLTLENGMFHLVGQIDENVDYSLALAAPGPVKLALAKVKNVNSVGVRSFLMFVQKTLPRGLEFHECSAPFMDMLNTFPATLGDPPDPAIVKSLVLTYQCQNCHKDHNFLMGVKYVPGSEPTLALKPCPKCKTNMRSNVDAEDLFTYMIAGD